MMIWLLVLQASNRQKKLKGSSSLKKETLIGEVLKNTMFNFLKDSTVTAVLRVESFLEVKSKESTLLELLSASQACLSSMKQLLHLMKNLKERYKLL
jgi:hypothetical protein